MNEIFAATGVYLLVALGLLVLCFKFRAQAREWQAAHAKSRLLAEETERILSARVESEKQANATLRRDNETLSSQVVALEREKGRLTGELVAANQRLARFERPRGTGGKFAAKPKPIT
jgi:K+-sensing histidine kinase KdpD